MEAPDSGEFLLLEKWMSMLFLCWKGAEALELVWGPFGDKGGMSLLFIKSLAAVLTESWLFTSKPKGSLFSDNDVYVWLWEAANKSQVGFLWDLLFVWSFLEHCGDFSMLHLKSVLQASCSNGNWLSVEPSDIFLCSEHLPGTWKQSNRWILCLSELKTVLKPDWVLLAFFQLHVFFLPSFKGAFELLAVSPLCSRRSQDKCNSEQK